MGIFSNLLGRVRSTFDPDNLAMTRALLAGDYDAAAQMAARFRQLQAEHDRLRMRGRKKAGRDSKFGANIARPPAQSVEESWSQSGDGFDLPGLVPSPATLALHQARSGRPTNVRGVQGRVVVGPAGRGQVELNENPASRAGAPSIFEPAINQTEEVRRRYGRALEEVAAREKLAEGLNGVGYFPGPGDANLLARIIYAESHEIPGDDEAIGWSTVNRIGREGYQPTLNDVLHARRQFEIVREGNAQGRDHPLYLETEHPERLLDAKARRWQHARKIAEGILSGEIPDPTGGATRFFASESYDPSDPRTAPGGFPDDLRQGRIRPSKYSSAATGPNRQYFFHETAPRRPIRR